MNKELKNLITELNILTDKLLSQGDMGRFAREQIKMKLNEYRKENEKQD